MPHILRLPLTVPLTEKRAAGTVRTTVGAFLAEALTSALDDPTGLTADEVDALEAAVGDDWTPLKDAIEHALSHPNVVSIDTALVKTASYPLPHSDTHCVGCPKSDTPDTHPVPRDGARITIELADGTRFEHGFTPEHKSRPGRGFAEYIGHSVANALTAHWGPFGPGYRHSPTDPASDAFLRAAGLSPTDLAAVRNIHAASDQKEAA